jgi:hypothetical protein
MGALSRGFCVKEHVLHELATWRSMHSLQPLAQDEDVAIETTYALLHTPNG